jgi:hypothetical protein
MLKKCIIAALIIAGALLLYGTYARMHKESDRIDQDLQRIREHMREHSRTDERRPSDF